MFTKHPEWLRVEKIMAKYMIKQLTIHHLQNELQEKLATGMRMTPAFYGPDCESDNRILGAKYPTNRIPMAEYIETIESLEERIAQAQQYRTNLETLVFKTFEHQPDKLKFIQLFFWSHFTNRSLTIRKLHVIKHMPFLQARDRKTKKRVQTQASSLFYYWRDEIYDKLAEVMGYKEEKKGEDANGES